MIRHLSRLFLVFEFESSAAAHTKQTAWCLRGRIARAADPAFGMLRRPLCSEKQLLNDQLYADLLRDEEWVRVVAQQILHAADHAGLFVA